jgi:thiamine transporter ThiT
MIEKTALRTAQLLYALAIGAGVIWLAWLCLMQLPWWAAIVAFCVGLPLLAMAAAPLVAGGALLAGLVVGLVTLISGAIARRRQVGG